MTAVFKSTMDAPLTEDETARIKDMWLALRMIRLPEEPDPVEMLSVCTELVMAVWEVRRAIDDGWYEANRRAIPRPRVKSSAGILADLQQLGFTNEQLVEAIKESMK